MRNRDLPFLLIALTILLLPLKGETQDHPDSTLFETLSWIKNKIETMDMKDLNYKGDRVFYEEFFFLNCECKIDFSGIKLDHNPDDIKAHRTILSFSLYELDKVIQSSEFKEQIDLITAWRQKKILVNHSVEFSKYGWKDYPPSQFAQYGLPVADPKIRAEMIAEFNSAIKLCQKKEQD
jgi:hypothetical protein